MTAKVAAMGSQKPNSGLFWAFVPVVLLASSVLGVGSMAALAARDPGFALEKNYYDRAVHWDRQQAEWAENSRLGYHVALELVPAEAGVSVVLAVTDRAGAKLGGASVRAEAFANARADARHELVFTETEPGSYRALLGQARPGLWEFRLSVSQGADRFTQVVRRDVGRTLP